MKIRPSIILFVLAMAALIALVLWHGKSRLVKMSPKIPAETSATQSTTNIPIASVNTSPPANAPTMQPIASVPAPSQKDKGEQMKEGLAAMNDVPVVFYGKLEDQFGSPVSGAQVTGDVRVYNGVQSTMEHLKTVSDVSGSFQLKGGKGESIGMMPHKDGYVLASTGTEFKYSYMYDGHFTPDPNNPTVIKMWKLQGSEPLVGIDKNYKLHYTSAPINFDLVAGSIVPAGGDVIITVSRSAGEVSEHNPQDWSVQVKAIDGGVIETSVGESRVTYAAPEKGYQPSAEFVMSTAANSWHGAFDQMFFVESRGGKVFSKVRLMFGINDTPDGLMDVTFSGVANANGSRNWEASISQ